MNKLFKNIFSITLLLSVSSVSLLRSAEMGNNQKTTATFNQLTEINTLQIELNDLLDILYPLVDRSGLPVDAQNDFNAQNDYLTRLQELFERTQNFFNEYTRAYGELMLNATDNRAIIDTHAQIIASSDILNQENLEQNLVTDMALQAAARTWKTTPEELRQRMAPTRRFTTATTIEIAEVSSPTELTADITEAPVAQNSSGSIEVSTKPAINDGAQTELMRAAINSLSDDFDAQRRAAVETFEAQRIANEAETIERQRVIEAQIIAERSTAAVSTPVQPVGACSSGNYGRLSRGLNAPTQGQRPSNLSGSINGRCAGGSCASKPIVRGPQPQANDVNFLQLINEAINGNFRNLDSIATAVSNGQNINTVFTAGRHNELQFTALEYVNYRLQMEPGLVHAHHIIAFLKTLDA
jgi:hypothetical protein